MYINVLNNLVNSLISYIITYNNIILLYNSIKFTFSKEIKKK